MDATYIALMPGSRGNELKQMTDLFIQTAKCTLQKNPQLKFITSAINDSCHQTFQAACKRLAPDLAIEFFVKKSHLVMAAADVVLVTSGTATLETMLFKRPMVIAYRVGYFTYEIAKRLIKTKFIGLPNLLADELLVPEFIQQSAKPIIMADALLDFINHPEKTKELAKQFTLIHKQLRCDASHKAAEAVYDLLK